MLDADLTRFEAGLNQTKAGLRLRMAIAEAGVARQQIRRLEGQTGRAADRNRESWRRAYIEACNSAALAIDCLWDEFAWPPDAARDRGYVWRPVERFRR